MCAGWGWGGVIYRAGGIVLVCNRLVSAAKVLCLSIFPVFSRLAVAAATPAMLERSGIGSAGPVRSGVEGFLGGQKKTGSVPH